MTLEAIGRVVEKVNESLKINGSLDNRHNSFDPDRRLISADINKEVKVERESADLDKRTEVKPNQDGLYSTRKQRIDGTGVEGKSVHWDGERGNSNCYPREKSAVEELKAKGQESIPFKDGVVDFSKVAEETVTIADMTRNIYNNYMQANKELAKQWSEQHKYGIEKWTPRDIEAYRKENGLTWHECSDCKTVQLVPRNIHNSIPHTGGRYECSIRDGERSSLDA